jgi:asparagine synthase (glutamine-hydrolysing)
VALNGQGPDELFGGYRRHIGVRYGQHWVSLPSWLRVPVAAGIKKLRRAETLRRALYSLDIKDRVRRYQNVFSIAPGNQIDAFFHDGLLPDGCGDRILDCWSDLVPFMENTDELGGLQFLELRSTLPDELLMYADKLSMAHSLEVRVPYLDREVVEYVERLKASFKVRNGVGKWLHRSVCRRFLPASLMRRKKRGFAVNVVNNWFRNTITGRFEEMLRDTSSEMYQLLKPAAVEQLLVSHQSGQRDNHKLLFSFIVCETLLRSSVGQFATDTRPMREVVGRT